MSDDTLTQTPEGTLIKEIDKTDTNSDGKADTDTLSLGDVSYSLLDLSQRADAEYQLKGMYSTGALSQSDWYSFTNDSSSLC